MIGHILYNPLAGSGECSALAKSLESKLEGTLKHHDITKIDSYDDFANELAAEDFIVVCGGDGTLNRFINDTAELEINNDIFYFPGGSGNDFLRDLGKTEADDPFCINAYLKNLPVVTVDDKQYRFLNGIGYGIDGYCCEVGDKMRSQSTKPVNYTSIAIKGLLYDYKPTNATVTVDGKSYSFKKVWLAPTMHGRFYGGGMMTAPDQTRNNPKGTVTLVVLHGSGKLKTLCVFPSIFKGEHIKHDEMVSVLSGKNITVEFDRPTPLQVDGETILNVTKYTVSAGNETKAHAYKVKQKSVAMQ